MVGVGRGFVKDALLMFRSRNGNKGDYHDSMDSGRFKEWFETQLMHTNIPPRSLIIMDNASYHSKIVNKLPNKSDRKMKITQWLEENGISHDPRTSKADLMHLIQAESHRQLYEIDELAKQNGQKVLYSVSPPTIITSTQLELIWAKVKAEIKKCNLNADQTLKNLEKTT